MNKLLIVHGYSDKSDSFAELAELLKRENIYQDIRYIDYDSVDDQATFEDFADRLNDIYEEHYANERIDVICHSTGSLVVRAWMVLRRQRKLRRSNQLLDVPVERLYMFAPANFGSDVATMGQSFVNRLRRFVTTGREDSQDGDSPFEVGKRILQGLEPASPEQWLLSQFDLHGDESTGYFGQPHGPNGDVCYAFVFAAGRVEPYFGDRIIRAGVKPGTDSTVRICGTSLNTRKCVLHLGGDLPLQNLPLALEVGNKAAKIPFAVFYDLNHTSLIGGRLNPGNFFSTERQPLDQAWSPFALLKQASQVTSLAEYEAVAEAFSTVDASNHEAWRQNEGLAAEFKDDADFANRLKDRYQQIFFRFMDDVGQEVEDVFIDFYVYDADNTENLALTHELDEIFWSNEFYAHSVNKSHRVVFFNFDRWATFQTQLVAARAKVILEISAETSSRSSYYERCRRVIYDPSWSATAQEGNRFFYPNTTTLVEVVLNRRQRSGLLKYVAEIPNS